MNRILVTYASTHGSTAEVAQAVAERLSQRGEAVDVRPVEEVGDLSPYRAVVAGSAVQSGRWLPGALGFVKRHRDALQRVPVAIFSVHGWNLDDSETSRQAREAYLGPVRRLITPRHQAFFAGRFDAAKLGFGARLALTVARAVTKVPKGDLRDWQAIRAWADGLFL